MSPKTLEPIFLKTMQTQRSSFWCKFEYSDRIAFLIKLKFLKYIPYKNQLLHLYATISRHRHFILILLYANSFAFRRLYANFQRHFEFKKK